MIEPNMQSFLGIGKKKKTNKSAAKLSVVSNTTGLVAKSNNEEVQAMMVESLSRRGDEGIATTNVAENVQNGKVNVEESSVKISNKNYLVWGGIGLVTITLLYLFLKRKK